MITGSSVKTLTEPDILSERERNVSRLKNFFLGKKYAFGRVFNYQNRDALTVLKDLEKFCYANRPTFHNDPRAHALAEGRREVWLRIRNYLDLNDQEFLELYGKELKKI